MTKDKMDQLPEDERQLLTWFRRASPAQRQAMLELMFRWRNGAGPDVAAAAAWLHNRAAEIEAKGGART